MSFEGAVQLLLLPAKITLWLAAALFVSERFAASRQLRAMAIDVMFMSATAPLFELQGHAYTPLDVIQLPLALAALWFGIGLLTYLLKTQVLGATSMDRGVQDAIALLVRYTMVFLGAIAVLQVWGIDPSSLAFVGSILGVGIGFGLQNIANNFVSGIIVSLERPVQPGDFVEVGKWMGTVERVGPRNTEIRTLDHVSILVPNSRFLETEVVNWSHRDPDSRLHVPVGVAYGTDPALVRSTLLKVARSHHRVLHDPPPHVELVGFGDSAVNFTLHVWTRDARMQFRLISDLNYRIEAAFRHAGIRIPFPQQDLHLRSPAIDRILAAWSPAEAGEETGNGIPPMGAESTGTFDDCVEPVAWSDDQLAAVVDKMRQPGAVEIADRRYLFTVYPSCFVGREAVDWMSHSLDLSRSDAEALGQKMVERGYVHHVLDEHDFRDGKFFYRFGPETDGPRTIAAGRENPLHS
jgi:small-conductance mechanosensitive channel